MPEDVKPPRTINVDLIDYIDRAIHKIEIKIDGKCDVWRLELAVLRKEWELEHKNLIQRYDASEHIKSIEKLEVDRHFERINGLQALMDKANETFVTKSDFKDQTDSLKTWVTGCLVSLVLLLIAVLIDIAIRKP